MMTITATPLAGGAAVTLGDETAGDIITDPPALPQSKIQVQTEVMFGAADVFVASLGNAEMTFSWVVLSTLANMAAVYTWQWGRAAAVPRACSLSIVQDATTTNFSQAIIEEVTIAKISGLSVWTKYVARGVQP